MKSMHTNQKEWAAFELFKSALNEIISEELDLFRDDCRRIVLEAFNDLKEERYGVVYIGALSVCPNAYKIGRTKQNIEDRESGLRSSFKDKNLEIVFAIEVCNCVDTETEVHNILSEYRLSAYGREVFRLSPWKLEAVKTHLASKGDILLEK